MSCGLLPDSGESELLRSLSVDCLGFVCGPVENMIRYNSASVVPSALAARCAAAWLAKHGGPGELPTNNLSTN